MTSYPPPPTPSRDVTPVGDLGLDATDAMMAVDPVTGTIAKAGKWVWEHKWDIGNRIISYGPTLRNIWGRMSGASKEEFNRWYRKRHYDNPALFEQALNDTLLDISSGTMLGSGSSTNFDEKALMKMVNDRYKEYCKGPTKGSIPYAESHAHNADPKWRAKMQQTYDPTIMDAPAKIAKRLKPGSDKKFVKIDTKRRKHDGNSYRTETGDLELIMKNRKQIENREDIEDITRYMDHMPASFAQKETASTNLPIHDVTMEKIKKERGAEAAFKLEHGDVDPKAVYPERQEKKFETKEERDAKIDEEIDKEKAERQKNQEPIFDTLGRNALEHEVINNFLGIKDDASGAKINAINRYAGGTGLGKVVKNVQEITRARAEGKGFSLKDINWNDMTQAAGEVYGAMNKDEAGGKWSPLISASINAAKTAFGVTNPLLGGVMTIGGMLLTSPKARALAGDAIKLGWSGAKLAGKGMKWLATRVGDGVIQVFKKKKEKPKEEKKEEPIQQRPLDDSSTNIPNIFIPQESQTDYMNRMTGGMDTGPANANVVTYSGYRKPQYEKVQNRVMLAPPKVGKKTVRVKVKRRKAK